MPSDDQFGATPHYAIHRNQHGVFTVAGPRFNGPHVDVWDHWDVGPDTTRLKGPATCICGTCGAEWPEGGFFPQECRRVS